MRVTLYYYRKELYRDLPITKGCIIINQSTQIFVKQEKTKQNKSERESLNITDLKGQINLIYIFLYLETR